MIQLLAKPLTIALHSLSLSLSLICREIEEISSLCLSLCLSLLESELREATELHAH